MKDIITAFCTIQYSNETIQCSCNYCWPCNCSTLLLLWKYFRFFFSYSSKYFAYTFLANLLSKEFGRSSNWVKIWKIEFHNNFERKRTVWHGIFSYLLQFPWLKSYWRNCWQKWKTVGKYALIDHCSHRWSWLNKTNYIHQLCERCQLRFPHTNTHTHNKYFL